MFSGHLFWTGASELQYFDNDKPVFIIRVFGVDLSNFVLHEFLHVPTIIKLKVYAEPSRTSKMKLFAKIVNVLQPFLQKAPSRMFDWVLNLLLQGFPDYHLPAQF